MKGKRFHSAVVLLVVMGAASGHAEEWNGEITQVIEDHFGEGFSRSTFYLQSGGKSLLLKLAPYLTIPEVSGCPHLARVSGKRQGNMIMADSIDVETAASSCSSVGEQKIAAVLLSYPGLPLRSDLNQTSVHDMLFGTGLTLGGYLSEVSFGKAFASGSVFGPFSTDQSFSCTADLLTIFDAALRAAGSSVDFSTFNKILLIVPHASDCLGENYGTSTTSCSSFSLPNGKTAFATVSLATTATTQVYQEILPTAIHEIGHSLGLGAHASSVTFSGNVPLGALSDGGVHDEYGDRFATMGGYKCVSARCTLGHFTAQHKLLVGWLDANKDIQTVSASGTQGVSSEQPPSPDTQTRSGHPITERNMSIGLPEAVVLLGINSEPVNDALKKHSVAVEGWDLKDAAAILHQWAVRFNDEFQLGLPTPAILLDRISSCRFGTYRSGRNGFGLKHEIALNITYLDRPISEVLLTLFHEQLHQWQELYGRAGKNNYHNRPYRNKALCYGLIVNDRGHNVGVEPGQLTELLSGHNIDTTLLPRREEQAYAGRLGSSKMRKWRCGCTNVRCAVNLTARCERCGMQFEEAPAAW